MGYTIIKIHEVWHFPEEQRKKGLFADYIDTWLKVKQKSAGYPSRATTSEDKARYINQYKEKKGITLDPRLIQKNGRQATAKVMLNSFWGKFGEHLLKPTIEAVYNASHLFALVSNLFNDVRQVRIANDDSLEVVYVNLEDNQLTTDASTSLWPLSPPACHARLKLHESLGRLQQSTIYFDANCVIYTTKPGQPNIPLGYFPGE